MSGLIFKTLDKQSMDEQSAAEVRKLLALKGDERPEEGYWDRFIHEFHEKTQAETAPAGPLARLGHLKWLYGASALYAAVAVWMLSFPREIPEHDLPASPISYQVIPAPSPVVAPEPPVAAPEPPAIEDEGTAF